MVSITNGIANIGVDGIGRGVPILSAGTAIVLNGLYIIFKRD